MVNGRRLGLGLRGAGRGLLRALWCHLQSEESGRANDCRGYCHWYCSSTLFTLSSLEYWSNNFEHFYQRKVWTSHSPESGQLRWWRGPQEQPSTCRETFLKNTFTFYKNWSCPLSLSTKIWQTCPFCGRGGQKDWCRWGRRWQQGGKMLQAPTCHWGDNHDQDIFG